MIYFSQIYAQVCDFGLSRFKANTFLSSKSVAGTVSLLNSSMCIIDDIHYLVLKFCFNYVASNPLLPNKYYSGSNFKFKFWGEFYLSSYHT
jgi:hypothetical protein